MANRAPEQYQHSLLYARQYGAKHREERSEYNRKWLTRNLGYKQRWNAENSDKNREYRRKAQQKKASNPKYYFSKHSIDAHKHKGCTIEFTREDLYEKVRDTENCEYCERPLDWSPRRGHCASSPSVDRINNANPVMTLDNIMICYHHCNAVKFNRPLQEFIDRFDPRDLIQEAGKI